MGISIWQLLIVLAIIVLLFGTKKLRSIGSDLGSAIKGFRESITSDDKKADTPATPGEPEKLGENKGERVIEGQVSGGEKEKV